MASPVENIAFALGILERHIPEAFPNLFQDQNETSRLTTVSALATMCMANMKGTQLTGIAAVLVLERMVLVRPVNFIDPPYTVDQWQSFFSDASRGLEAQR